MQACKSKLIKNMLEGARDLRKVDEPADIAVYLQTSAKATIRSRCRTFSLPRCRR